MARFHFALSSEQARRASAARAGKNRHKGKGHPTTSDPDYTARELEFIKAIEEFKNRTGRKFPTWREVLIVLDRLGYRRETDAGPPGSTAA